MLKIDYPFHGAVLNHRHGKQTEQGLTITVTGDAPSHGKVGAHSVVVDEGTFQQEQVKPLDAFSQITVNGRPVAVVNGRFSTEVTITEAEQDITAVYDGVRGHQEHAVRVVWDRYSVPRYRFSIDDNSFWLRDVTRNDYASLYDCFYLAILRDLNREFGAKFVLNIYFEADDGFCVTEFPEKYRGEFEDAADWLALSCHAYANEPDRPYQYAAAEKLAADLDLVEEQIVRFAGERTLAAPTVIHWGMVLPSALPMLHERGVRVLSGFGHPTSYGYDVNYWLDHERAEFLAYHDALKDLTSGIVFSKVDIVCNNTPIEQIEPTLQAVYEDDDQAEIMDLFTHEQYFWPFWRRYIPDHGERLAAAIRFVTERGYEPVHFHKGFLGGRSPYEG